MNRLSLDVQTEPRHCCPRHRTFAGHVISYVGDFDGTMTLSGTEKLDYTPLVSAERARRCRTEETIISTVDMPTARDWVFLQDCDVLALSCRLDQAGRERAIAEARRKCALR